MFEGIHFSNAGRRETVRRRPDNGSRDSGGNRTAPEAKAAPETRGTNDRGQR